MQTLYDLHAIQILSHSFIHSFFLKIYDWIASYVLGYGAPYGDTMVSEMT